MGNDVCGWVWRGQLGMVWRRKGVSGSGSGLGSGTKVDMGRLDVKGALGCAGYSLGWCWGWVW